MPRAIHEISPVDAMHRVIVYMDNDAIVLTGRWTSYNDIATVSDGTKTYIATTEYAVGLFGPQHTDDSQVFEASLIPTQHDERIANVPVKFTRIWERPIVRK